MKKQILTLFFALLVLPAICLASDHGHKQQMKKGILLVAFGSSIEQAQISFENIDKKVKAHFPDTPFKWAFTSSIIRKKQ